MKMLFGKGNIVEEKILNYLGLIKSVKKIFADAFLDYLKTDRIKNLDDAVKKVHSHESKADDIRRDIEQVLYGKVLLPEFRGDIVRLLERLDRLPNECQTILYMITLQNIKIPKILKNELIELIKINSTSIDRVIEMVQDLFKNPGGVKKFTKIIDKLESQSDSRERGLIKMIFYSKSIDKSDMINLKELILKTGSLSDNAERVSDMTTIINIKVKI